MVDCIQRSRIGRQYNWICSSVIFLISTILVYITNLLFEYPQDKVIWCLIVLGIFPIVLCSVFCYKCIVYFEETKSLKPTFIKCIADVSANHQYIGAIALCCICSLYGIQQNNWCAAGTAFAAFLFYLTVALIFTGIYRLFNYDDAEISCSQLYEKSIGAVWAVGAYKSYYEISLKDIIERMNNFEKEHSIQLKVKKLIIICPLSCKIQGSLPGIDDRISHAGDLKIVDHDQGANMNRRYKQSVFAINSNNGQVMHIVAEFASPLGTLWEERVSMESSKLKYHRDCLIKSFKDLLQNYPCVILEYDDQSPRQQPLSEFLLSSVYKLLQDRKIIL